MNRVTIDNIDLSAHVRYAKDREELDTVFLTEPQLVAPHTEITGTSSIYSSKWEDLFDIHKKNLSWAHFSPPDRYYTQSNRFFSYCLLPDLYEGLKKDDDTEEDDKKRRQKRPSFEEILNLSPKISQDKNIPSSFIEKDRSAIISLLESINSLNSLLAHVQSRKLQYQKG